MPITRVRLFRTPLRGFAVGRCESETNYSVEAPGCGAASLTGHRQTWRDSVTTADCSDCARFIGAAESPPDKGMSRRAGQARTVVAAEF